MILSWLCLNCPWIAREWSSQWSQKKMSMKCSLYSQEQKGEKRDGAGGVINKAWETQQKWNLRNRHNPMRLPPGAAESFLITLPEDTFLQMKTAKIPFMAICWVCCCSEGSLSGISRNTEETAHTPETDGSLCPQITEPGPGQRFVLCRICSRV